MKFQLVVASSIFVLVSHGCGATSSSARQQRLRRSNNNGNKKLVREQDNVKRNVKETAPTIDGRRDDEELLGLNMEDMNFFRGLQSDSMSMEEAVPVPPTAETQPPTIVDIEPTGEPFPDETPPPTIVDITVPPVEPETPPPTIVDITVPPVEPETPPPTFVDNTVPPVEPETQPPTSADPVEPVVETSPDEDEPVEPASDTVWDVITKYSEENDGEFSIFMEVAEAAGLDTVWNDTNKEFTIFAPTNSAFDALPIDSLLMYLDDIETWGTLHLAAAVNFLVIEGQTVHSYDLQNDSYVIGASGLLPSEVTATIDTITDDTQITLSNQYMEVPAKVIEKDIEASNGVVHAVDQVLVPGFLSVDALQAAILTGAFSILIELLEIAGLTSILHSPGPMTIFAPPDIVFQSYGEDFIQGLRDDPQVAQDLILNHVVLGDVGCGCESSQTFTSAYGSELVFTRFDDGAGFTINGIPNAPGFSATLLVSNAVIGVISNLLIPGDFKKR